MYVNGGHYEHLEMQYDYGGNSPWQMNSKKINKRKEELGLVYNHQQVETLKDLIGYSNLRMYINFKNVH
jgi:hypothetical protein